MEAPTVRELPDTTHRGLAVVHSPADTVQLASIELPDQDTVNEAAEGHLLGGDVNVLSQAARAA